MRIKNLLECFCIERLPCKFTQLCPSLLTDNSVYFQSICFLKFDNCVLGLFANFTVLQNVSASFHLHPSSSLLDTYFNTKTYRRNEAYILEQSLEILRLVGLDKVKDELARNLPHGYQKMLGMARALATKPKLLLLDEPLGGMNPSEIDFTLKNIGKTREQGVTILIVEHNMRILDLCDRVLVINFGQKICEGSPREVRENKDVITAYFGGEHVA